MAELDHLIFASKDVQAGAEQIKQLTGAEAVPGGPHVGLGTHNHLLTFDERTYFEIIGITPTSLILRDLGRLASMSSSGRP